QLLVLNTSSGTFTHRWRLGMGAVGWPAAIAGVGRRLYVAGQPQYSSVPTAVLEALTISDTADPPRVAWRQRLGLTHAGIWLGLAGPHAVAGFLPDSHDLTGSVAIWDTRAGALLGSYAVPGPAVAA